MVDISSDAPLAVFIVSDGVGSFVKDKPLSLVGRITVSDSHLMLCTCILLGVEDSSVSVSS